MKLLNILLVCAWTIGFCRPTPAAVFPVGLESMQHLERLPEFFPNGTQTKQFITYDPAGDNRSGFFKRYEQNGEYVFFDEIGPGCLYRQQMNVFSFFTKFPAEEVRIRYYFDDEPQPRIDMTFAEFFGKGGKYTAPFSPPLAYFDTLGLQWDKGPGSFAVLYYPLPFNKRLKIAAYHPAGMKWYESTWFQYTYLKYPSGEKVETWKGKEIDSQAVRTQFEQSGQDPKPPFKGEIHTNTLALAPGETKTAFDLAGQGAITSLRLNLQPWTPDTFFHTRLRITWDDQSVPAVDMPISSFFGGGGDSIGAEDVSGRTLTTLFYGFDTKSGQCYAYWPMPYWSRAHIQVVNESKTPLSRLEFSALSAPPKAIDYERGKCGYFCAKRTVDISPDGALYSQAFKTQGRGKVMGLSMYSTNYNMDGDEYTFIDGSRTPQIHGDGTEDDHNQGWGGYAVQKPYWGGLVNGFQGGYRLYINEPYIFDSSIDIGYEHSKCGNTVNSGQKTDFTVWYYLDQPGECNLKLTDEFDVGKTDAEKAHHYRITREKWSGVKASSYDRMENAPREPTVTDDGRAFAGSSEFTVKIDPASEGVKIRRRVDRNRSNVQRTDVYVDGRLIADAPWYVCDLPVTPETVFRDTDYEIPVAFTKGKDHLTIRLQHVSAQDDDSTNEFYYWIFSYGRTSLSTEPEKNLDKKDE
jgi:hypothetical protein